MDAKQALAEANRRRYPEAAAAVDHVRKYWPDAKVVYLGKVRETLTESNALYLPPSAAGAEPRT